MSKPSSFNDPWDRKPWFNSSILDDPQERERHLEWLLRTAGEPADAPPAEEMRANPMLLKALIEQVRDGHIRAIDDQYRVYCLSPEATIPLMWAHYGDNHRGVALEFDTRADQLVAAYKVYYSATYPTQVVYISARFEVNCCPAIRRTINTFGSAHVLIRRLSSSPVRQ